MKQVFGQGRGHQGQGVIGTRRLTKQRHVVRIAAKYLYVVSNPLKCADDIQCPIVAGVRSQISSMQLGMIEPAEKPKTIVYGYDDDVLLSRQSTAVISAAMASCIAAAMHPHHNG